jgi:cell division protein FtsB
MTERVRRIRVERVVALLAIALLLMTVLAATQLVAQYSTLADLRAAQQPSVAEVAKVRAQLDTLVTETTRLAASGNTNARAVVDEMRRQGITLRPPVQGQ